MAESTAVIVVDKAGRIIARVVPNEITRFRDVQLQATEAVGLPPKTRVALICPGDNFVSKVRQLAALGPGQHRAEAHPLARRKRLAGGISLTPRPPTTGHWAYLPKGKDGCLSSSGSASSRDCPGI